MTNLRKNFLRIYDMTERFEIIADIIRSRRSIKPVKMNGKKIPDEQVKELLKLANWAPTHGRTEPWRLLFTQVIK